ncbi:alcohol oxidase [Fomitiporia mediterranea MF3/22]|uniref:alcohol oxidase n=1 Tax=Fomitiporia mediterranea (strain MF3/22) TaxID=694068 RepID=UPI0004407381|nr:alcohol oxidase [Fomitiporia mediterranea MF3/22]EJC99750.1 alcohol oxidase [Fomitiporia mediterranea MF3/22]
MFLHACTLALALPLFVAAAPPTPQPNVTTLTTNPLDANGQTFDYIVVGAGLTGMTVASRLSEDPSKTVLLIEAGLDNRTDPGIFDLNLYPSLFGTSVDWAWQTDQNKSLQGGRMLGGSSSFTACHWLRGMKDGYDAIGSLIDGEDWSFDALFPYMKKAEKFFIPTPDQIALGADYVYDYHGYSGPVQVTFPQQIYTGPQEPAFVKAIENITGIAHCQDFEGGFDNCVGYMPRTFDPAANFTKSTSATAYLSPIENQRPNWRILMAHQVTKILLTGDAPQVKATGVEFKDWMNVGDTYKAYANREVILAAGAIGTPQLLQLSGIGDSKILSPLGIDVIIDLPTVGKQLQERTRNELARNVSASFNPGGPGPANTMSYPSLKELFTKGGGSNGSVTGEEVADYITAMYPIWAQKEAHNALNADALTTIFKVNVDLMVNSNIPAAELFFNTLTFDIGLEIWQMNPFSRGNVTITSTDAFVRPQVNINYFDIEVDLAIQTAAARLARQIFKSPIFGSIFAAEELPGTAAVPDDDLGGTDADWQAWILENYLPVGHYFGTAPMMRRNLGGVVDGKLCVYDTLNLRIVDGSIISLPMTAAPMSSLYGMAEKAADIIKSLA